MWANVTHCTVPYNFFIWNWMYFFYVKKLVNYIFVNNLAWKLTKSVRKINTLPALHTIFTLFPVLWKDPHKNWVCKLWHMILHIADWNYLLIGFTSQTHWLEMKHIFRAAEISVVDSSFAVMVTQHLFVWNISKISPENFTRLSKGLTVASLGRRNSHKRRVILDKLRKTVVKSSLVQIKRAINLIIHGCLPLPHIAVSFPYWL